jgi:hypothetical protein
MDRYEAQQAISAMLLEKIENDHYPSATQMDLLEQTITPELAGTYVEILLDKLNADTWPSLDLLRRVQRVAEALPQNS